MRPDSEAYLTWWWLSNTDPENRYRISAIDQWWDACERLLFKVQKELAERRAHPEAPS